MSRLILGLIILFSLSTHAKDVEESQDFTVLCEKLGGHLDKGFKCPNTSFPLLSHVCFFKNTFGEEHFTDGCTGPSGGHNSLFLESCVKHDLCYHHEPASTGKSRKECDDEFFNNLMDKCRIANDSEKCERWARTMVKALRVFGGLAYKCDNSAVTSYIQ